MKIRFYIFLFSIFGSLSVFAQEDDKPKVDTSDAVGSLLKLAGFKCDSAALHIKNKDEKVGNHFYQDAIKDYKKAMKVNATSFDVYFRLGIVQTKTKDYKTALTNFDKAINIDTGRSEAFRERAICYLAMGGKQKEALEDLDRTLNRNYEDVEALYQRGMLRETGKDPQPALEDYGRALDLQPNFYKVLFQRGKLYYEKKKDFILALADFARVIEINPDYNEAYLWRGKTNFAGGDFKSANKDLSRYIDYETENKDAYLTRGAARLNVNDYTGAMSDFDEVIKLDPKNFMAYMNRGTAKAGTKNFSGALEDLDMSIKIKFDYSPAYVNRAAVKFASGDKKGACNDLNKADALNNEQAYKLIQKYCDDGSKK